MADERQRPGQPGAHRVSELADTLMARIRDGDLPSGTQLQPSCLASVLAASLDDVASALERLEGDGATMREGDGWVVRADRMASQREILARARPLLVSTARLAAQRCTPALAASFMALRDRVAGLSGDGTPPTRIRAYAALLRCLAGASGSAFHITAMERLLAEAQPTIEAIVRHNAMKRLPPDPDGELARLGRALMAGDPASAAQAAEDHVLLVSRQLDWIEQGNP